MRTMLKTALAALVLLPTATIAHAGAPYSLTYSIRNDASFNVVIHSPDAIVNPIAVIAAPFAASWTPPGNKPDDYPNSFDTFCVDIKHYDASPTTVLVDPVDTNS